MGNFHNELRNYSAIPRDLVFDGNMSDRARFVYVFMACKPDDWDFYLEPMAREIGYSVDTLRKYIAELVESGWLVKGGQRNENGVFGSVEYTLKATNFTDTENFRHGKNPTLHKRDNNNIKESNIKIDNIAKGRFSKPTVEDIRSYAKELGCEIDAEQFYDHYESNGWCVGKAKMKDWKATVRNWIRKRKVYGRTKENFRDSGASDAQVIADAVDNIAELRRRESEGTYGEIW